MSDSKKYLISDEGNFSALEEAAIAYNSPALRIEQTRVGIAPAYVVELMNALGFSKQETSRLTDISSKTLDRHIQSGKRFTGLQADRLIQLSELLQSGIETFGQRTKFVKWLNSTLPALDHTKPKDWLDTYLGIQMISDELGRIRHGIFA